MTDINFTALSGSVSRWGHTPPSGSTKWHRFWILTHLEDAQVKWGNQQVVIQDQKIFLNVKIGDGDNQTKILNAVKYNLDNAQGSYFIATDATISSYFSKKKSQEIFELSVGLSNLRISHEPKQPENLVVLCGKVTSVSPGWIQIEERYRNPRGEGKDAWRGRKIWVYTTIQMNLREGARVYVRGRLANRTPDGREMMYVIAKKIS